MVRVHQDCSGVCGLRAQGCSILWKAMLTLSSTFPLLRPSGLEEIVLAPPSGQELVALTREASRTRAP